MSIITYFKETRAEMTHVNWPTRRQAVAYAILVVAVSVITAGFLGFFDFLFSKVLGIIIG